jgi:hypothetical protein
MSRSTPKPPKRGKAAARADYTEIIADAAVKVARAQNDAFVARLDAIDTILEDADPYDVLMVCAHVLAQVMPLCCEAHEDEFKAEFLQILGDCVEHERDAAEGEGGADGDAPRRCTDGVDDTRTTNAGGLHAGDRGRAADRLLLRSTGGRGRWGLRRRRRGGCGQMPAQQPGTVIQVANGGRGFVLETEAARYVITAAHCLSHLPEAFGAAGGDTADRTYADFLGPLGTPPAVWAECVFVDPVADLAVFGEPDSQELGDRVGAYRQLTDSAAPFALSRLRFPRPRHRPSEAREAMMLSLDGEWFACRVVSLHRSLWIEDAAQPIRGGMSGSPIILPDGSAVGVVCVGDGGQARAPNPLLSASLPAWLVRDAC